MLLLLDRIFKLKENGTNVKQEICGGIISFLAVSYILAVNPAILGQTGMDPGGVLCATALAAFTGTLLIAIFAISVIPTVIWTFAMSRKDSISD